MSAGHSVRRLDTGPNTGAGMVELIAQVAAPGTNTPGWFFITAAGIFGAIFGSFLNVVIYRLPRQCLSVVKPRSMCPGCKAPIAWYDNIPVLSWLILNGKCRRCKQPISMRYPMIELLVAGLFALLMWFDVVRPGAYADPWAWVSLATHLAFVCLLVAAGFIDADLTIIPDEITYGGTVLLVVLAAVNPQHGGVILPSEGKPQFQRVTLQESDGVKIVGMIQQPTMELSPLQHPARVAHQWPTTAIADDQWNPHWRSFLGAFFGVLIAAGGMWLLRAMATGLLIRKALLYGQGSAMGMGDVKLLALFGAMLGWPGALLSVFFGAAIGLLVTLPMMLAKNKHLFPFGPFLAIAALVILLFYGPLMEFILSTYGPVFGVAR